MKKIIFIIVLVTSLVIIGNLIGSIYTLWHKQDLLTQAQKELQQERNENKSLKKQLQIVNSQSFLEEEARNKLFLVKSGEQEVLINQELLTPTQPPVKQETRSNWQQWVSLFFH